MNLRNSERAWVGLQESRDGDEERKESCGVGFGFSDHLRSLHDPGSNPTSHTKVASCAKAAASLPRPPDGSALKVWLCEHDRHAAHCTTKTCSVVLRGAHRSALIVRLLSAIGAFVLSGLASLQ